MKCFFISTIYIYNLKKNVESWKKLSLTLGNFSNLMRLGSIPIGQVGHAGYLTSIAMKRILSRFGAYSSYLIVLAEDTSVKAFDRAKLRGFSIKWSDAKYILGCVFFSDLLLPCANK